MKHNAIYTDPEARERWCPFARDRVYPPGTAPMANQHLYVALLGAPAKTDHKCVASACMAWRWHTTHVNNPDDPKADLIEVADVYGYCGLAGNP